MKDNENTEKSDDNTANQDTTCPVCGEELNVSGRCKTCYSCGFSLCSM